MSRFICAALASAAVAYFGFHVTGLPLLGAAVACGSVGAIVSLAVTR